MNQRPIKPVALWALLRKVWFSFNNVRSKVFKFTHQDLYDSDVVSSIFWWLWIETIRAFNSNYFAGACSRQPLHFRHPWRSYDEAGQLIAEYALTGKIWKEYIYLHGQVIGYARNGVLYYVHNDHLGRAERITNQSKATVWRANNNDFDRTVAQNSIGGYNLGFPGQYWDQETGLYYNYFRDYDPKTGRYIQSDPIGLAAGVNTYAYVGANPINWFDPLGLRQCRCDTGVSNPPAGTVVNNHDGTSTVYRGAGYHGSPTLTGVTGLPGRPLGPLSAATANDLTSIARTNAENQRLQDQAVLGTVLGVATLGQSAVWGGGALALTTAVGFTPLDYKTYTAGNSIVQFHYSHVGHNYTITREYDADGNLVREDLTGSPGCR